MEFRGKCLGNKEKHPGLRAGHDKNTSHTMRVSKYFASLCTSKHPYFIFEAKDFCMAMCTRWDLKMPRVQQALAGFWVNVRSPFTTSTLLARYLASSFLATSGEAMERLLWRNRTVLVWLWTLIASSSPDAISDSSYICFRGKSWGEEVTVRNDLGVVEAPAVAGLFSDMLLKLCSNSELTTLTPVPEWCCKREKQTKLHYADTCSTVQGRLALQLFSNGRLVKAGKLW